MSSLDTKIFASMNVANELTSERIRQVKVLGYDAAHDDREHSLDVLLAGAASYLCASSDDPRGKDAARQTWPFDNGGHFENQDQRTYLVRAGAMVIAAIELLDRRNARGTEAGS